MGRWLHTEFGQLLENTVRGFHDGDIEVTDENDVVVESFCGFIGDAFVGPCGQRVDFGSAAAEFRAGLGSVINVDVRQGEDELACKEQAYRKAGGQMNADPFVFREDMYACLQEKGYNLKKG